MTHDRTSHDSHKSAALLQRNLRHLQVYCTKLRGHNKAPVLCCKLHELSAAGVQALLQAHALGVPASHRQPGSVQRQAQAVALALHLLLACRRFFELQVCLLHRRLSFSPESQAELCNRLLRWGKDRTSSALSTAAANAQRRLLYHGRFSLCFCNRPRDIGPLLLTI